MCTLEGVNLHLGAEIVAWVLDRKGGDSEKGGVLWVSPTVKL